MWLRRKGHTDLKPFESNISSQKFENAAKENNNENLIVNTKDDIFMNDPPCDTCQGLQGEHERECSTLKDLMNRYVPVKNNYYPIVPFPQDIKQNAIEKYLKIYSTHKCAKCKEFSFKDDRTNFFYCSNYFVQFTLLNAEFR